MTGADIAIAVVVLLSAVIGLMRGLVREVLSLVVWILAFLVAVGFADDLAGRFAGFLEPDTARLAVAFVTLFVGTLIVGGLIQWALGKLIEGTGLSGTDRLLGFLFGSLRGVLVCIVAIIALRPFLEDASWWAESRLIPELAAFESDVLSFLDSAADSISGLNLGD